MHQRTPQQPVKETTPLLAWVLHSPIGGVKTVIDRQTPPTQQAIADDQIVRVVITNYDDV